MASVLRKKTFRYDGNYQQTNSGSARLSILTSIIFYSLILLGLKLSFL